MTTHQPPPPAPPPPPGASPVAELGAQLAQVPTPATGPAPLAPPRTARDLVALRQRREDLSTQLISATERREKLAEEVRSDAVAGQDRTGLEARIQLLDRRILQLESDLAVTGQYVTNAPAELIATAEVSQAFGGLPAEGVLAMGGLFTLAVFAPLAFAAARLMWRRASRPAREKSWESSPRFERLENAIDTIAEEVERVSEGQRFVAKLLSESHGAPAVAPAATPAVPAGVTPQRATSLAPEGSRR